jgi:hypothetical protein
LQRRKEVDSDLLGRAHFDPTYAHEEQLTHEDLGLEDLHDPTDTVIENRLRQVRRATACPPSVVYTLLCAKVLVIAVSSLVCVPAATGLLVHQQQQQG